MLRQLVRFVRKSRDSAQRWAKSAPRIVAAVLIMAWSMAGAVRANEPIEFNRDVRPVLADKCFACHGPDKNKRQADLRLDTEAGLHGTADGPGPVVPGKPLDSELLRRIKATDPEQVMPPPDSGKQITPAELAILERWIAGGAKWEGHWAFQPLKRTAPPQVTPPPNFPLRNPIDQFVLAGLERQKLRPSPVADPVTLVRRLSFDLRGLPPTQAEVDEFASDPSDARYEALVERFLNSSHYGERMAIWWLDLVRYADSVGYHGDQPVNVFPYRQYVIEAFQNNKRFDQFTLEQLAGDLLPNPTLEQQIASGYNRLGMMSAEGGVQPKEYLAKYIAERVRNLSGAWLGLTLGCCECHSHKYDPFTSRDFYRLQAFFADIEERGLYSGANASGDWGPRIQVPTPDQTRRLTEFNRQIAELNKKLETPTPELAAAQAEWERNRAAWTVLKPSEMRAMGGATLNQKEDGSILASGESPPQETYTLTFPAPDAAITAFRLEVLPDDSLPQKGPGRAGNGNFVLTEFVVRVQKGDGTMGEIVPLQAASATYEQTGAANKNPYKKWSAEGAIDGDSKGSSWGWAIMEQVGRIQSAVFETREDLKLGEGDRLVVELQQKHENPQHTIGRFRLAVTTATRPVRANDGVPADLATIVAIPADQRSAEQAHKLAAYYRSIAPLLEPVRKQLAETQTQRTALEQTIPTTLVTKAVTPRTIRVLPRGNWMNDSGEICEPAFPEVLPQRESAAGQRMTRLDLAKWVVAPDNPLTPRTLVNRQWKLFFGAGLSRKLDDLGAQGEWPSHPELLDWLAGDLIDSGWDLKRLVRQLVLSSTYRLASLDTPALREADPSNRWLSRQSRFRLDAEMVRDNALAVSGLLVDRQGGASVKPYQPPGYWAHLNFPQREWQNGRGDELHRRGLYTHWQRQYLHPSLLAFDAPSREECVADRPRSNTPLQSLVLLNDPTYVEAARALAARTLTTGGASDDERLRSAMRLVVSRPPTDAELATLRKLLERQRAEYRQDAAAAKELTSVGETPAPESLDRAELAAWTSVARVLLNLHETITRY